MVCIFLMGQQRLPLFFLPFVDKYPGIRLFLFDYLSIFSNFAPALGYRAPQRCDPRT